MWLITTTGFFSVVEKPRDREHQTVTVRARVAADLEALRTRYLPALGPTEADPEARQGLARSALYQRVRIDLLPLQRGDGLRRG